jgi:enoyl-CoA hydratase/carnithine racemase
MEFEHLSVALEPPRATIQLNRPERMNALNAPIMRELVAAARWLDAEFDVRVVIVSGAGRAFSAGADLKEPPVVDGLPTSGKSWGERREVGQLGLRMADAIEGMRAVTIAKIHGFAVGGGLVLAAACDLRVAAEDTHFPIPEIDLGIPLAWGGVPRLVREIGPALTKELVMTCRRFGAEEARSAGFLNRVVSSKRLDAEVNELCDCLVRKPAAPLAITKEHVNSVARGMASASTSFADGDVLLGAVQDPAAREASVAYTRGRFDRSPPESTGG